MKTFLKVFAVTLSLTACAPAVRENVVTETVKSPLPDRVQAIVVETQKNAIEALPAEIAGLKSAEPVADREKNQRGAGFTRVYSADDIMATVFVYNNQIFNVSKNTADLETLMDKHLQEFQSLKDSGLYANVKTGEKKPRDFRWKRVKYQVLEAYIDFSQKDEAKKSLLVLGANGDLMSYVRIRYTAPKSKLAELNKKQTVFTRAVLSGLHDFAAARTNPAH